MATVPGAGGEKRRDIFAKWGANKKKAGALGGRGAFFWRGGGVGALGNIKLVEQALEISRKLTDIRDGVEVIEVIEVIQIVRNGRIGLI
jgi:hypothetical protein